MTTVTIQPSDKDTRLSSSNATTNYGTEVELFVRPTAIWRISLIEHDITWGTDIPDDAIILSAHLMLYYWGYNNTNPVGRTYKIQRLARLDWIEAEATWTIYKTGLNWTTAGAGGAGTDYVTDFEAEAVVPAAAAWMSWDVTRQVKWAKANAVNPAFRLVDEGAASDGTGKFHSNDYVADTDLCPKLVIVYASASKGDILKPLIKITFSKSGESDIVKTQDDIISIPSEEETTDSQTAEIVFDNSDDYYTDNDLKGWDAVMQWGLVTEEGYYVALPPFKVISQHLSSWPGALQCRISLIGIPNRLAEDKASDDYVVPAGSEKTVKDLITEVADGTAVTDVDVEEQETSDSFSTLYNGVNFELGQRLTISSRTVTALEFYVKKTGNPSGNMTFYIAQATGAHDTLLTGTYACSNVGTSAAWHKVTFGTPVLINESVWLLLRYSGGDFINYIQPAFQNSDIKADEVLLFTPNGGNPTETASEDTRYRYYFQSAGVGVFSHCEAYTATFDSEDSLIDVYKPQDAFRIAFGSSRLAAINKLLRYTGCVKRVESDGEIHIFVPTISGNTWVANTAYILKDHVQPSTPNNNFAYVCTTAGTTHAATEPTWPVVAGGTVGDGTVVWTAVAHDDTYSLVAGEHNFYSKSGRTALVIPNNIVVESFPEDDDSYTGSATSAASYALLPVSEFIRTKLESNAQGASIAKAYIAQLEINAQRGAASVPINLTAEVYDYVKVTDSRQSDVIVGNTGYIKRSYTPGTRWQMNFSFGKLALKAITGTKPSALRRHDDADQQVVRWGELDSYMDDVLEQIMEGGITEDGLEAWGLADILRYLFAPEGFVDIVIALAETVENNEERIRALE